MSAAAEAVEQREMAAALALQLFLSWPQMKLEITSMASAEPWLNDLRSVGSNAVSLRPSKPVPNLISGVEHLPKLALDEDEDEDVDEPVATALAIEVVDEVATEDEVVEVEVVAAFAGHSAAGAAKEGVESASAKSVTKIAFENMIDN